MRKGATDNDVLARLAADPRLGLTAEQLDSLVAEPIAFTGAAVAQTQEVLRRVADVTARHPEAAAYAPAGIL
jgi:adenylosuccinate lyase